MIPGRRLCLACAAAALHGAAGPALAQSPADYAVRVSAAVQTSPPRITLSWPADPRATGYALYRKSLSATSWGAPVALASNATSYVDSSVTVGSAYEYRLSKTATTYNGFGYIHAGIQAPLVESRGKVVLLVDATHASILAPELARLQQDLAGDGWTVLRHDVARTSSVPSVKALIIADYSADPSRVKSVFLVGHVPVPYSGDINPDAHTDHKGAWPADVYYGEMNGAWADTSVNNSTASDPRNRNVPGDGKYDASTLPSDVELAVGRVDLANLPAFALGETELLRQYLNKAHHFRHKLIPVERRGLVDDHFGTFNNEAFAVNGWRNFAPCFGASNTFAGDWLTTLRTQSHLWGYGCGGGSYASAGGVASTSELATNDPRVVFTMLFGSYFGDWDSPNNLLRASLATPTYTLACAWAGRPHWMFHPLALGETVGFSARLTQNNSTLYDANVAARWVHIALLGDPTLRMHPLATPTRLTVSPRVGGGNNLAWLPSPDAGVGYGVYRAASGAGPFARLHTGFLGATNYSDPAGSATSVYMVRAVNLEVGGSGSYSNASQGIFQSADRAFAPPGIAWWEPTNHAAFVAPARFQMAVSAFDYARSIARVEFFAHGLKLGEDTSPPFGLGLSNVPPGTYTLSARAATFDGATTNSDAVTVRVDAPLVSPGATWKYLDDGSDQGTAWQAPGFDDTAWASGPAELGYSNSPATVVSFGPDPGNKVVTTYFRHAFVVEDPALVTNLTLGLVRDDGAAVYLNGAEVFRSNLPLGPIDSRTLASTEANGADESGFFRTNADPAWLVRGTNVLAAEVHLAATNSPDMGFNLVLLGSVRPAPPALAARLDAGLVVVSWPANAFGYQLESASSLSLPDWASVTNEVATSNWVNSVVLEPTEGSHFFRLRQP